MTIWLMGDPHFENASTIASIAPSLRSARKGDFQKLSAPLGSDASSSPFCWQYVIGPIASIPGGPTALIGLTAASPCAAEPQCAASIAASLLPDPSGAVTRPATIIISSGNVAH